MTAINRDEVNEAIWKVLNTKFKKDAKDAFELVESAGYSVYKDGCGQWNVCNSHTNRVVYLNQFSRRAFIQHGPYFNSRCRRFLTSKEMLNKRIAFDFVGCLEKSVNSFWSNDNKSKNTAIEKYSRIRDEKYMIRSYERDIDNIKHKIEALQDELIRCGAHIKSHENDLKSLRKEYGLNVYGG